jgi:DNA-binding HxlR family transcriptional regulator
VAVRSYGQFCAIASALDTIGDRWTLLIIRELLTGPKRYSDLLDGLPGIPTDMLAARLRRLGDEGLVERDVLPPPAASRVYALTESGLSLEPVVAALARWGMGRLPSKQRGEFRVHWLKVGLRSLFVPSAAKRLDLTVDFHLPEGRLRGVIHRGTLEFDEDPSDTADVIITGDAAALARLASDPSSADVTVEGDANAIVALQRALGLTA